MTSKPKPYLLWIAFLSFIAIGLQGSALNIAWLYMQASFDRTLESIGIVLLAGTLGGLVVSFFSGRILSFMTVGMMCLVATIVEITALITISITPNWWIFVTASLLLGLGRSGINVAMNTFVAEYYPTSRMNWLHAIFGFGSTVGPLLVTYLVVTLAHPWREAYSYIAFIQIGIACLFLFTLKDWRLSDRADEGAERVVRPSFKSTLSLLPVWLGVGLFVCHVALQMCAGQLSNNLFVEGRGIDPELAGLWISLFWAFITLGRLFFGSLIDRFGVAAILRLCTLGTLLGGLLIWLNPSDAISFLGLGLMGFTLGPVFPSSVSRTPALVGRAHSPNAIGFQMTGAGIGGAFIPGMVAFFADNSSLAIIPPAICLIAFLQFLVHEFLSAQERKQLPAVSAKP
ncbi:MAG: MFS transporter [Trueperaceae bacterium]|nr:MFS transporter [Trueperaceae bacterium]